MITETERLAAIAEADRSILKQEVRSYEVSLWTLQDEFITVLKWSDVEQKTRLHDPEMILNIDGTEKLTFSIPMYLEFYENGGRIVKENPIWYTTQNGMLIEGMRKIKVVFNKTTADEQVFEFVILRVTEEHESDKLTCKVECEGLAFHELGKIGYKYSLSEEDFLVNLASWQENGYWIKPDGETKDYNEPQETVDYWCEQCFLRPYGSDAIPDPRKWYYKVEMDWRSFEQTADEDNTEIQRESNKIYEESYATNWNQYLEPDRNSVQAAREKNRPVSINNSNIYNITQTIAETFNVYCRYEYGHDANQHITSRTVVFYNNYMQEDLGIISFTYPYTSKSVTRELDSTDIITKMYVTSQDDSTILGGNISITDSIANKTQEDYLLNFDYMYKCGAITQEQYDAIAEYERAIRANNIAFTNVTTLLDGYETTKVDLEAEMALLDDAIGLEQEQLDSYNDLYNRLDAADGDSDGYFERTADTNYRTIAMIDSANGKFYIKFNGQDKGLKQDSIKCYKTYSAKADTEAGKLQDRLTVSEFKTDDYGEIIRAYFGTNTFNENSSKMVYVVYKYSPTMYYESVLQQWQEMKEADTEKLNELKEDLEELEENIADAEEERDALKAEKTKLIREFEAMMGPALREGYWSPSTYQDRGEQMSASQAFPSSFNTVDMQADAGDGILVGWDNNLFDGEEPLYYEYGAARKKVYYPCIDISNRNGSGQDWFTRIKTMMDNSDGSKLAFIWQSNYYKDLSSDEENSIANLSNMTLGGRMELGYIRANNDIKPVLILTGVRTMSDDEIKFMLSTGPSGNRKGHPRICMFNTYVNDTSVRVSISDAIEVTDLSRIYWYTNVITATSPMSNAIQDITSNNIERIYPRLKFSNARLRTTSGYLAITYNNAAGDAVLLDRYKDYTVLPRTTIRNDGSGVLEYFITIKPEVFLEAGTYIGTISTKYTFSNAATSIYLDAKQVLKENSEPRASYKVEINVLNKQYMRILYSMLAQLVIVNDTELKFREEYGYISEINLKLDKPWEDTIEVKNYKTKFEDLFSTIVAQTEEMKKNSAAYGQAATGNVTLTSDALSSSLEANASQMQNFFDTYFDGSEVVSEKLKKLFTEAGEILSESNAELNEIREVTSENYEILEGFTTSISTKLTPRVFNSVDKPTVFKAGDIWNKLELKNGTMQVVARYVATSNSEDCDGDGWTRTFSGSLAAIRGAALEVDAVDGTVNVQAENEINIQSGGNIDIAANDNVTILGNKEVNIGGTTINIAAGVNNTRFYVTVDREVFKQAIHEVARVYWFKYKAISGGMWTLDNNVVALNDYGISITFYDGVEPAVNIPDEDYIYVWYDDTKATLTEQVNWLNTDTVSYGSINLVATGLCDLSNPAAVAGSAQVNISPLQIYMASSNLKLEASSAIQLLASNNVNTSVIKLSSNDGIYVGSNMPIKFFSGTDYSVGANAIIDDDHIVMGVVKNNEAFAFNLTAESFILAGGDTTDANMPQGNVVLNESQSITGLKLTKTSFGLAIGTGATRTVVVADNTGLTLGTGASPKGSDHAGSYVTISGSGVDIGTSGNLYLNTNNVKLQSDPTNGTSFALGSNMNNVSSPINTDTIASASSMDNGTASVGLVYNTNGLFINGDVYAQSFTAINTNGKFIVDGTHLGFYKDVEINNATHETREEAVLTMSGTALTVASGYSLDIGGDLNITTLNGGNLNVSTTNVVIDSGADINQDEVMFRLGPAGSPVLNYTHGNLTLNATGSININAGSSLSVTSGGTLSVNTTNVLIDTSATNGNPTFRIGTSAKPQILYSPTGGLAVNKITATDGTIGGWTIDGSSLTSGNMKLSSTGTYAINCNDQFMVDFSGNVWIKALYVGGQYIDFTKAFEQAISVSLAWNGDGKTASVNATVVGWGVLNCVKTIGSTISLPTDLTLIADTAWGIGSFSVPIIATLEGGSSNTITFELSGSHCDARAVAANATNIVWNQAKGMLDTQKYTSGSASWKEIQDYHMDNGVTDAPSLQYNANQHTITANATSILCYNGDVQLVAQALVDGTVVTTKSVVKTGAYRTYHSVSVPVATYVGTVDIVDYSNHVTQNGITYYASGGSRSIYSVADSPYYLPD